MTTTPPPTPKPRRRWRLPLGLSCYRVEAGTLIPAVLLPNEANTIRRRRLIMKPQITLASACVAIAIICVGVGAAGEWGGGVGALAMVALFSTVIFVVAIKGDVSRAWAFAAIAPAVVPFLLLGFVGAGAVVSPDMRYSQRWEGVLDSLHVASLMASGPLGIIVTLAAEDNYPWDCDWEYGSLLAGVAAAQWFGAFRVGQYWLRYARKSRRSAFVLCLGVTLVTLAAAYVLHVGILAGRHS